MNAFLVIARALHVGAAMLLFGELLFVTTIAYNAGRRAAAVPPPTGDDASRHAQIALAWALAVSAASGVLWLAVEAASMSGAPLDGRFDVRAMTLVLRETMFGRVWSWRGVVWILLALSLLLARRATDESARHRRNYAAMLLAAVYLGTLAWAGHAAATLPDAWRAWHLGSDVLHVLAAGAWLGALPALAHRLRSAQPAIALPEIVQRFSVLGIFCVLVLLASGIVNACFLVGSFAALFGTPYGRVLIVKLAVFAALLGLAARNRFSLTPRLERNDGMARRSLRRNAGFEIAGGLAIIGIVGALGAMVPGAHQSPVWPFPFALDVTQVPPGPAARIALVASFAVALVALVLVIRGARRRTRPFRSYGLLALFVAAAASAWAVAIPAYPTTYAISPVAYSVTAVAHGAARYSSRCSECHGSEAHGNGPAAAALATKPSDLARHAMHHRPGELFWWIASGIPATPMPAFSPGLSDRDIWELVQYLTARSSAEVAQSIGSRFDPTSMSAVPDFTYEAPGQGQRTLRGAREPALVVLYSRPESLSRLAELAADRALAQRKLRIIAIPLRRRGADDDDDSLATRVEPDAALALPMFAQVKEAPVTHAELLIDPQGVLRARWIGTPSSVGERDAQIIEAAGHLPGPATMPAMMHHAQ